MSLRLTLLLPAAAAALLAGGAGAAPRTAALSLRGPILELKADGGRAIAVVGPAGPTGACVDVVVWQPSTGKRTTLADHRACTGAYGVALAGDQAAWVGSYGNNVVVTTLRRVSVVTGRGVDLAGGSAEGSNGSGSYVGNAHGDGPLLVYNRYRRCQPFGSAGPACPRGVPDGSIVDDRVVAAGPSGQRMVARSPRALTVLAAGGGRVVARRAAGGVVVLDAATGRRVSALSYRPYEALAAATDGRTLAVLRKGKLDVVPLARSGRRRTWTLPPAKSYGPDSPVACLEGPYGCSRIAALRLTDLDGGLAVYVAADGVHLLDVATGRSARVPAAGVAGAQLEPDGLYVAAGNKLTFTPRSRLPR